MGALPTFVPWMPCWSQVHMCHWQLQPLTFSLLPLPDYTAPLWNPGPGIANTVLVFVSLNYETLKGKGQALLRQVF